MFLSLWAKFHVLTLSIFSGSHRLCSWHRIFIIFPLNATILFIFSAIETGSNYSKQSILNNCASFHFEALLILFHRLYFHSLFNRSFIIVAEGDIHNTPNISRYTTLHSIQWEPKWSFLIRIVSRYLPLYRGYHSHTDPQRQRYPKRNFITKSLVCPDHL